MLPASVGRKRAGRFKGFDLRMVELPEAMLRVHHGGSGPPLLLLHSHPRTHVTWNRLAPLLAKFRRGDVERRPVVSMPRPQSVHTGLSTGQGIHRSP